MTHDRNRIGKLFLEFLNEHVARHLWHDPDVCRPIGDFEVGDRVVVFCGDAVSEDDWDDFWRVYPDWYEMAYMLDDNGTHTFDEVGEMTVEQVREAFKDVDSGMFDPVFHTEVEEDDLER